jgi:predicted nucleic acid-binding protein
VFESWVINASPIILLAKVGLIERVPGVAESMVVPQPVVEEILRARGDAAARWLSGAGRQFIRPAVAELTELSGSEIGSGERAVISWAAAHRGFSAVLDDREARTIARRLGIKIIGTVGVVLRLKQAGLIHEVKPHLMQIKQVSGYISDDIMREALRSAGESSSTFP